MPHLHTTKQTFKYLYGPVPSRRLGFSLGIDIVPYKNCSFDCIYCQLGRTVNKTISRREYAPIDDVVDEIKSALAKNDHIDYLTLSGSGEPTLHSGIGRLIDRLKKMTTIPIAVLTNGSLFHLPEVRGNLMNADVVLPTLCTVNARIFETIHRGAPLLDVGEMIKGYIEFRKMFRGEIWLEVMIIKDINDSLEQIVEMKSVIDEIHPDRIHLNTVVRPPSEEYAAPAPVSKLHEIKQILGDRCEIIAEYESREKQNDGEAGPGSILKIIQRRPVTIEDLIEVTGLSRRRIAEALQHLIDEGKVITSKHGEKEYYRT